MKWMGFTFTIVYVVDMISHSDILILTFLQPVLDSNTDQDSKEELLFSTQVCMKFFTLCYIILIPTL